MAEWEQAAAAVLRKARRLTDDDPDDAVWAKLTHRTLDGIEVTPLGTRELVADLPDPVRPPARGDGWDIRSVLADPDADTSARAARDRPGERRHLPARAGRSLRHRRRRPGDRARGRAARRGARWSWTRPPTSSAPRGRSPSCSSPTTGRSLPGPTSGWTLSVPLCDPVVSRSFETPSRLRTALATLAQPPTRSPRRPSWPGSSAAARWWSTGPRCTTSAPPTCRSSATCSRSGRTTCARSPRPGSRSTRRDSWWSSGSRPATSSSRRSPSCAPYAGCGRGCSS